MHSQRSHRADPLRLPGLNLTTLGTLNVWIDGSSLCASTACGYVLFNGGPPLSTPLWSHRQVKIVVTDPESDAALNTVQVVVGGVASNTLVFRKPVPAFPEQPRPYTNMSTLGGQNFKVRTQPPRCTAAAAAASWHRSHPPHLHTPRSTVSRTSAASPSTYLSAMRSVRS